MTGHTTTAGEPLLALVDEQLSLYGRLDELSRHQHKLIGDDDTDGLLRVLGERQVLIERITDASARMAPFRARWDDHVSGLGEEDRSRLRRGLDDLSKLMGQIAERDESDRAVMEHRRESVKSQLGEVKRGSAAVSAYGGSGPARGPRFQDRSA